MGSWWIMKVKNKAFIGKLAKEILNANKSRRNILLIAITLTSILFTSIFSVGLGLVKSMELQTMKVVGTTSHGVFKELSNSDIEILSKDKDIKEFSVRKMIGILENDKISAELSYQDKNGFDWSLVDDVEGKIPEKLNEAFIDISTAKKLGYRGELGENIEIPFNIEKPYTGEIIERKTDGFIISGTFKSPIDSNVGVGRIYLSKAYADTLNLPDKIYDMEVMLKNSFNIKEKLVKIADRNGYKIVDSPGNVSNKELRIGVNFAYLLSGNGNFDFMIFLPALFLLILVMLAGFLIINNIFKISVNEDINLIGLLKTLGMTRPQIKKLLHLESLIITIPSVIIGNIIGISLGKIILNRIFSTNVMLTDIKLSIISLILIIIFSAIFTLLTVFLSVMNSARYASKISPIDASGYNDAEIKKKYKSDNISLAKLAIRQVFSNKFRFISIVLSMSLSAVILNSFLTYTGNIDLEKGVSDVIATDYNVASPKYFRYMYLGKENSLSRSIVEEIEKQKGFTGGGAIYSNGFKSSYPHIKIEKEKIAPVLFGMDDYLIKKQNITQGNFDLEKWKSGNYIIIAERTNNVSSYQIGDKFTMNIKDKTKEVEVLAKINYNFSNGLRYYPIIHEDEHDDTSTVLSLEYIYMPTFSYNEFTGDEGIMSYGFDVENSEKENFDNLLKSFENDPDFSYDSRDLQIKSFKDFKNLIKFVGYSLSAVLFLISVLNFINIMATEILKNMVYLSILEAIGMTKKKIKSYLVKKNLLYSIFSFIFSIIFMILVNHFIMEDFIKSTKWTSFKFVILPLIIVNLANIIIGILFTRKFYESHSNNSLVERIKNLN